MKILLQKSNQLMLKLTCELSMLIPTSRPAHSRLTPDISPCNPTNPASNLRLTTVA